MRPSSCAAAGVCVTPPADHGSSSPLEKTTFDEAATPRRPPYWILIQSYRGCTPYLRLQRSLMNVALYGFGQNISCTPAGHRATSPVTVSEPGRLGKNRLRKKITIHFEVGLLGQGLCAPHVVPHPVILVVRRKVEARQISRGVIENCGHLSQRDKQLRRGGRGRVQPTEGSAPGAHGKGSQDGATVRLRRQAR